MPRNRRPQEREAKRGEIVAAARTLFVERGFDATPMSAVAKAAGVTANTIYWYFSDKDDVLIAVLDDIVRDSAKRQRDQPSGSEVDQLVWLVEQLASLRLLIATIHARIEVSEALNAWHDRFHEGSERLLADAFRDRGVPEASIEATVKITVFVIEGLVTHALGAAQARSVLEGLVASWPAGVTA